MATRGTRVVLAGAATALFVLAAFAVVMALVGARLEGACRDRQPPELWAPVEVVTASTPSTPAPAGLISFRCEAEEAPQFWFEFTDPVPLLIVVATSIASVVFLALLWMQALRRRSSADV